MRPERAELAPVVSNYFRAARETIKSAPDEDARIEAYVKHLDDPFRKDALMAAKATAVVFRNQYFSERAIVPAIPNTPVPSPISLDAQLSQIYTVDSEIEQEEPLKTEDVRLPETEQRATEREITIKWATDTKKEYDGLPKQNSRQRQEAKRFVEKTVAQLIERPEDVDAAGSVWKTIAAEDEADTFYHDVLTTARKHAKENWRSLILEGDDQGKKLAELTVAHTHSALGGELADELLKGFFDEASSKHGAIDRLYAYLSGVIDLYPDQPSFEAGVRIGTFETDILPLDSELFMNYCVANGTIDDDELLTRTAGIDNVSSGLRRLVGLNPDMSKFRFRLSKTYKTKLDNKSTTYARSLLKRYSAEEVQGKFALLEKTRDRLNTPMEFRLEDRESIMALWPMQQLTGREPLRNKFEDKIGRSLRSKDIHDKYIKTHEEETGERISMRRTIVTPDGIVIDISIPQSLEAKSPEIISAILSEEDHDSMFSQLEEVGKSSLIPIARKLIPIDKTVVYVSYRLSSEKDRNIHPLSAVAEIGFPTPTTPEGITIEDARLTLVKEIKQNESRFLNRRGVRVPIDALELRRYGYKHIDYKQDPTNPERIQVTINLAGQHITVFLDRNFNFDFEGKSFQSPAEPAIHYAVLKPLEKILCEPADEKNGGTSEELGEEVVTRMAHISYLGRHPRTGKLMNYTQRAVDLCREYTQGRVFLPLKNEERRELQRRMGIPGEEIKNTTFRSPVVADNETNLDPITVRLPNILQFEE